MSGMELVHPTTGEVVDLAECPADTVISLFIELAQSKERVKDADSALRDELERRRRATSGVGKVVRGERLEVVRSVSRRWDTDRTVAALKELVDRGLVTVEEADALAPEVLVRKPSGRGLGELVSRLTDSGEFEAAQILLAARSEYAKWEAK